MKRTKRSLNSRVLCSAEQEHGESLDAAKVDNRTPAEVGSLPKVVGTIPVGPSVSLRVRYHELAVSKQDCNKANTALRKGPGYCAECQAVIFYPSKHAKNCSVNADLKNCWKCNPFVAEFSRMLGILYFRKFSTKHAVLRAKKCLLKSML